MTFSIIPSSKLKIWLLNSSALSFNVVTDIPLSLFKFDEIFIIFILINSYLNILFSMVDEFTYSLNLNWYVGLYFNKSLKFPSVEFI